MEMLNQHHSRRWPNAFTMLNSTMLDDDGESYRNSPFRSTSCKNVGTLLNLFTQGLKRKKKTFKKTFILAFLLWSRITSWGNRVGFWKSFLPIAAARKTTKLNNPNYMSYTACTFYLPYEDKIVALTACVLTHSNTKPSRPKTGKISQFSIFNFQYRYVLNNSFHLSGHT